MECELKAFFLLFTIVLSMVLHAQDLQKISLQLQWKYQFQFAGFIMAKELGYYEEVGLDVELLEYNNTNSMKDLVAGKVDFAINNSVLVYEDRKLLDVTLLATYFQRSPLVLIVQPEIKNILDLKGKRILMSKNNYFNSSLSLLLEYFSITFENTTFLPPTFNLDDFIQRKVDAITAFKSNEVFELEQKNIPYAIIDPVEYGFSTNAINLFTSLKTAKERPKLIYNFLQANRRGWQYALDHIDEVAALIHQKYQPNKSLELLKYEGRVTKELMLLDLYDIGEVNKEFVYKTYKQLIKKDKIDPEADQNNLIYQDRVEKKSDLLHLSAKEKKWIQNHPIITYSEVNWKPLSIIENGHMSGVMGEYLDLVAKRTGLTFKYVPSRSWPHVLEQFKNKKLDLVPGIGSSQQEIDLGLISTPFATYPMGIVTNNDYSYLDSLDEFNSKTIAVPKYYTSYNFIVKNYPDINVITTQSIEEALLMVEAGTADAFVGHIAPALYYLSQLNLQDLKVSGTTSFNFDHRYLIQEEFPELRSIINKAFASISEKEHFKINANWIHTKIEKKIDKSMIYKIIVVTLVVVLFLLYRQKTLQRYNRSLQKLKERMELALIGSQDAIWDWNLVTNEFYISPRWQDIVGYSKEEQSFVTWRKRVHPKDLHATVKAVFDNIKGETKFLEVTHRIQHKDGHYIWVLLRGKTQYDEEGRAIRMIGTQTDVTKDKEMQLQITRQSQALNQIHDSVISMDLEGVITSWNQGSTLLLDYSSEEMIGTHITRLYLKEDLPKLLENINTLKAQKECHATVRLVKKSGEIIYAELSLSLLKDEDDHAYGMIGYAQDITQRKLAEEELIHQKNILDHQAHHDFLTNLPNRILFHDRLSQGIEKAKRRGKSIALFFIDLDRFKQINDSLGHAIGDEVLQTVTSRLQECIRKEDTLARLGGDEFTIIIENLSQVQSASLLAQKILAALEKPILIDSHTLYVSSSIGISLFPQDASDAQNLLKNADAAMYRAKDEGRNNFQFYSAEMTELAFERVVMESSLRQAITNNEFVVYYQPQVNGKTDTLIGMEALVRWNHPSMGLVSPAKFIPLAVETGMIVDIDEWVMKQAMKQMVQWCNEGLKPGVLALNLSMKRLQQKEFIPILEETLHEIKFKPQWLELEVTEDQIMTNPQYAITVLKQISDLGIELAIDDFGTGYSSLSYLKRLPIDKLKIDQSFIRDLPYDEEDVGISKAVIALSKSLNLNVIAEGVETLEQKNFLVENGCEDIQGYFYGRPMPAHELKENFL
jgi:diguanylate cyclase (GGDEF)-like protein/PAS domain S-box-containing protein